jgi:hypothetical protein
MVAVGLDPSGHQPLDGFGASLGADLMIGPGSLPAGRN